MSGIPEIINAWIEKADHDLASDIRIKRYSLQKRKLKRPYFLQKNSGNLLFQKLNSKTIGRNFLSCNEVIFYGIF